MKLTELKCTACNGTLKLDEKNPHIAVCEYCRSRYVLEDEGEGNVRLSSQPIRMNYVPQTPGGSKQPSSSGKPSGRDKEGWIRAGAVTGLALVVLALVFGPGLKKQWDGSKGPGPVSVTDRRKNGSGGAVTESKALEEPKEEKAELTGLFGDMASIAIGKPAGSLTDEDLAGIRWVEYKYSSDHILAGYSFEDPMEDQDADLTWLEFDRDKTKIDMKALSRFTGLKALSVAGYVSAGDIKGLKLERISCYGKSMQEMAAAFEDPGQLKDLRVSAGLKDLEGVGVFTGLERLTVRGSDLTDIKALAGMKGLKSLTMEYCNELKDFSVLSVMTWLEEVSVQSENMKDIGFVKSMPALTSLSLSRAEVLNLDSLKGNTTLKSLAVEDCSKVTDLSAVSGLTGLTKLRLDVPYNCPQPDLRGLSGLKELAVSGMDTVGYLAGMGELEELVLEWVDIDATSAFAGLTNLKRLKCSRIPDTTKWGFVSKIPALEILDLNGVATYEDISGLFGMPALRELYLNGVECELDFGKLSPNGNLEVVEMDGVKLYKNVQISGGGGIVYVDYDKVSLDEHTDFLGNYPGLKSLSLSDNMLTGLEFAAALPELERLTVRDNYITDIKPLEGLGRLRFLDCTGNPVENYRVLSQDVTILQ